MLLHQPLLYLTSVFVWIVNVESLFYSTHCHVTFRLVVIISENLINQYLNIYIYITTLGFPGGASDKEPVGQCRICKRCRFDH